MHFPTILDTIGQTPLVRLAHLSPNKEVTILVKCEFMNPSSSIKDRIVHYIIEDAEKRGILKPGATIVEGTSGNTGAATAMIGAIKGYKVILSMPDKVSQEKQDALRAYGAEIVIAPTSASADSPEHYVNVAKAIEKETPNSFRINQYDNLKNPEAHYHSTGPEIWEQTQGKVDYFIAGGSTGGTISGIGRYLKEKNPAVKTIMPDPVGSMYFTYFKTREATVQGSRTYHVEGVGEDHLTKAIDFSVIDEVVQFTDQDAFTTARLLAQKEGILAGGSSGANVWAAIELAKKLTQPALIVTVLPDSGIKYLSKCFNDDWMREKGFLLVENS